MRALTVKQPWAAAIAHGPKRIENRGRRAPAAHVGTTILIHAGLAVDKHAMLPMGGSDWPRHFGAIIALADLAGCHQDNDCCRPWGQRKTWHWELANARPVPHPILGVRGMLGLWTVPDEVLAAVQRQVYTPERTTT